MDADALQAVSRQSSFGDDGSNPDKHTSRDHPVYRYRHPALRVTPTRATQTERSPASMPCAYAGLSATGMPPLIYLKIAALHLPLM